MAAATVQSRDYPHYDELLDTVYRTRDWWRTIYILDACSSTWAFYSRRSAS